MAKITQQRTIKDTVKIKGIGLHSGATVHLAIHPASAGHGIVFVRSDLKDIPRIKADISKVVRTDMCTVLGNEGQIVATVEHLMAALTGLGVDNAVIEVDAPEIPIMDGSALEFVLAIEDAGILETSSRKKVLVLKKHILTHVGDKVVEGKPLAALNGIVPFECKINCRIEFTHPVIGAQTLSYNLSNEDPFKTQIASARTFGFLKEVEYLHKKGLALGGSLQNAVVLDDSKVLNKEGLRFADEFVRHKILDAIGDFSLLGVPIIGEINLFKSGHEMHAGFLRKILSDSTNYEIVELPSSVLSIATNEAVALNDKSVIELETALNASKKLVSVSSY